MARLSSREEKVLKELMRKREAPDAPSASRALNISIDLGDEKQVERAQRLGLLDMFSGNDDEEDEERTDGDGDDDDDEEEAPRRRGYFT